MLEDDAAILETNRLVGVFLRNGANPNEVLPASNTSCAATIQEQRTIGLWQEVAIPSYASLSKDDSSFGRLLGSS